MRLITIAAFLFFLSLLITVIILIRVRNKKRLHSRQLKSMRQEKEVQLLQALMQGEEKERTRIANDLHDGVAGMLAAVKMHFISIAFNNETLLKAEDYKQGIKLLDEVSLEVRKTSQNLVPEVSLQHGLDQALLRYCLSISNTSALVVQYDSFGMIGNFVDSFELSVYRIVQELLNNILKHSMATQAFVQLSQQNDILSITIEDNYVGDSYQQLDPEGMAVKSLQSRIKAINGKIEWEFCEENGVSAYLEFETANLQKEVFV